MRRTTFCSSTLITLLILVLNRPLASAQTVVISSTNRGWYNETGFNGNNWLVGDLRGADPTLGSDYRNYFVFDLAGVTQPIASARLALTVPNLPPPNGVGYSSPDPSENYELHDVVAPIATLINGTGGVDVHVDLGSGVVYGSRTMTAADIGTIVEITLNSSAIAALDAATGLIGLGGSLTTLDGLANNEYTFGFSGSSTDTRQLRLTLVPEPSTLLLLGIGAISLLGYRKAKSHG